MNLLLLTDEIKEYSSLENFLSSKGYKSYICSKKDDFYSIIRDKEIKIIILDLTQEETEDFAYVRAIENFDPLIEVIIIGPEVPASKTGESIKLGASEYQVKPFQTRTIQSSLKKIQDKILLRKETYQLEKALEEKYSFQGMVGKNPHMLDVFSLIERVAKHSVSVLVLGDTGTGKEMIARAIHNLSPRKSKNLVTCDCTAIPETLFESELFGYMKGAFTGADKQKDGLFKDADGGTIFLDEIGEMPVSIQSKLLRVLQEQQFRPLGANKNVKVDVRVISATSRELRENIKNGGFREDLFHRINVIEIKLTPLKERKEDITLLASHFLKKYNKKYQKNVRGISQRAKKVFLDYPWPGNVRELENIIERTVMLCQDNFIDIKDFSDFLKDYSIKEEISEQLAPPPLLTLDEVEKNHILRILERTDNNKQKAAKILGLSRQALYRKLEKHSIPA